MFAKFCKCGRLTQWIGYSGTIHGGPHGSHEKTGGFHGRISLKTNPLINSAAMVRPQLRTTRGARHGPVEVAP